MRMASVEASQRAQCLLLVKYECLLRTLKHQGIQFKDSQLQKRFENCGVFIDSTELLPFIEDLENDRFIGEEEIEKTIDKMDQESKEYLENLKNEEKKK